ncbi:MAG: L,D-transpeptidase family protein [Planctomycetota bacterium]|jgi:nucleoid-associated protein YgaU
MRNATLWVGLGAAGILAILFVTAPSDRFPSLRTVVEEEDGQAIHKDRAVADPGEQDNPVPMAAPAPSAAPAAPVGPAAATGGRPIDAVRIGVRARADFTRFQEALGSSDRVQTACLGIAYLHRVQDLPAGTPERREVEAALVQLERDAVEAANLAATGGDASGQHLELTVAYLSCSNPERRARYRAIVTQLADGDLLSTRRTASAVYHSVERGDSLARIAKRYDFPIEGIQRVNGLRSAMIRVGQTIKVPRGPVRVIAFKRDFRLVVLSGGRFLREVSIGIGRDDCSPEADFVIEDKSINPTWYGPDGVYPFGHPKNVLGTRWLGFKDLPEHRGFGIHGTKYPESIGKAESSGCLRVRNAEVEELYTLIPAGARVTILP